MCVICAIPGGEKLPADGVMKHCWEQNPHNGGFMYVNNKNRLVVRKFDDVDKFITALRYDHELHGETSPFVFHLRYATHGDVTLDNTHPFKISKQVAFVHNGTIKRHTKDATKAVSDTRVFKNEILMNLPTEWLFNPTVGTLLDEYIGGSKLVIMDNKRRIHIVNEKAGEWVDGLWYSNKYYKEKRVAKSTTTTTTVQTKGFCRKCSGKIFYRRTIVWSFGGLEQWAFVDDICWACSRDHAADQRYKVDLYTCTLCEKAISGNPSTVIFSLDKEKKEADTLCTECGDCMKEQTTERYNTSDLGTAIYWAEELKKEAGNVS